MCGNKNAMCVFHKYYKGRGSDFGVEMLFGPDLFVTIIAPKDLYNLFWTLTLILIRSLRALSEAQSPLPPTNSLESTLTKSPSLKKTQNEHWELRKKKFKFVF